MEIKCLPLGDYQANCYIVTDDESMTAAVIDPGVASDELNDVLLGYELKYILLTHGHFDHIFGCESLKNLDPEWRNDDAQTLELKKRQTEIAEKKAEAAEW